GSNQQTLVLKRATTTIPIVAMFLSDPITNGIIVSFSRPGGNVTGLTIDVSPAVRGKQLELIKQVVPGARRVIRLSDPSYPGEGVVRQVFAESARRLEMTIQFFDARTPGELPTATHAVARERPDIV